MALGANIWNMAFFGCFIGGGFIWRYIMRHGASKRKIWIAGISGCIISMQFGAFFVTLETLVSGITELPFTTFLAAMQPIHLAIGLIEGVITSAVLMFVYEAQPGLLWGVNASADKSRMPAKRTLTILGVCAVIIAGGISLCASALPDGLEWSIAKIAGDTELTTSGDIYDMFLAIQERIAIMPDYAFRNSDSAVGTSVSGILGAVIVFSVCIVCCYLFRLFRKRRCDEKA